ncbi:hypothetical protein PDIDSM_4514 [Penicillium digitatum]|nr:hypothetical protein PDIDSM_4514 [Penicillium digitatum]
MTRSGLLSNSMTELQSAQSTTWDNTSIQYAPDGTWGSLDISQTNAIPIYGKAHRSTDMMNLFGTDIPSSNLITVEDGYQTYPGGQNYPLEVGTLALGAQYVNQTFGDVGGNLITGWLWNGSQTIQSNTYGMHIGFFALGIPGSLMLGGYDQSRVLGDVSVQPHTGSSAPINLLDVSLGVATGGSPWNSTSKENLLAQGNSSLLGGTTVIAAPVDPYLYLPQSSCDAIAAELPVTHNSDLGLYAWNTDDPQYQRTYSQKTLPRCRNSETPTTTSATAPKSPESSDSEGFSRGAKVGISAGCGAAVFLFVVLLVLWLVRRQRRQKSDSAQDTAACDALAAQQASTAHLSNGSSVQSSSAGWVKPCRIMELGETQPYQGPF